MRKDSKKRRSWVVNLEAPSSPLAASRLARPMVACPNSRSRFFRLSSSCKAGLPDLCIHFRPAICWIQVSFAAICRQTVHSPYVGCCAPGWGPAMHVAPDSALRCCCGHFDSHSAIGASARGLSAPLAHAQAAFSRNDWRGVRGFGAGVAQCRAARLDSRRGVLADCAGGLRCVAVCVFLGYVVPAGAAAVGALAAATQGAGIFLFCTAGLKAWPLQITYG